MVALMHSGQANYLNIAGQQAPLVGAASSSSSFSISGIILRMIGNGHGAVIFFFVLSGFVLTMMLHRGPQHVLPGFLNFAVGRIFRIYPAIISTLVIFTAVFILTSRSTAPPESFNALNLFLNALLVKSDLNGVMWSLQSEMVAVPLIFFGFVACRRWGLGALVALAILLVSLSFSKQWRFILGGQTDMSGLYSFVIGAIAFERGQWLFGRIGAPVSLIIGVAGFALARPLLGWWSNWSVVFEAVFAGFIVASLAWGQWRDQKWLSPLSFIGKISYSFYLLHPLTLVVIWQMPAELGSAVGAGWSPSQIALGLFVASSLAIMPIAWLQHRLIELPGIFLGHAVLRRFSRKDAGKDERLAMQSRQ